MALTYDKVISVISQNPGNRKDFEVNNILNWFRKKSDLFRNLKTELLVDLVKNLKFVTKKRDELIIKQGDYGDCMYILLRGQVTIYILYAKPSAEGDEDKPKAPVAPQIGLSDGENIRQQLGTFVTNLGPGATFGEVALLKEDDCLRTASIIASDNAVDLIEINRDLYNRSVKYVLQKEFEDKTDFIATNPFFQTWAPKYKKQLAMALEKDILPYDSVLTKQGDPLAAIYFIIRGEVKVVMDPTQHKHQYPKYYEQEVGDLPRSPDHAPTDAEIKQERVEQLIQSMSSGRERASSEGSLHKHRKQKLSKKPPVEVCLLGCNEVVGDIETLLEMETYMQTAKCTQKTEVLVLEMKHYERLLVKRNPRTIDAMKECLNLRLQSRMSKHNDIQIPLLRSLHDEVVEFSIQLQTQIQAKQNRANHHHHDKLNKHQRKTIAEYYESFIPKPGPLVDMYGPGTVFHRIREREKSKKSKKPKTGNPNNHSNAATNPIQVSKSMDFHHNGAEYRDPITSDPMLRSLEERMRSWLEWDGTKNHGRVSKLHRSSVEEEGLKPGAKVVFRPRGSDQSHNVSHTASQEQEEEDESYIHHGKSWKPSNQEYHDSIESPYSCSF